MTTETERKTLSDLLLETFQDKDKRAELSRRCVSELKDFFKSRGEFVGIEKLETDDFSLSFEFYFPEAIDEQELIDGIEKILKAHGAKSVEIDGYQFNDRRTVDANFLFEHPNNGLAYHG